MSIVVLRVMKRWGGLVTVLCLCVLIVSSAPLDKREQPDPALEQLAETCGEIFTCNRKTEFCDQMVQQCVPCEGICPGTHCSVYCPDFTSKVQPKVFDSRAQNQATAVKDLKQLFLLLLVVVLLL